MAVEAPFERSFSQADVFFPGSIGADRCLVHERRRQALAVERALNFLSAVALSFVFC